MVRRIMTDFEVLPIKQVNISVEDGNLKLIVDGEEIAVASLIITDEAISKIKEIRGEV